STIYYLSALAVAIGFRMNLFNIGVDGQYRFGAMAAAVVGGAVALPGPLEILLLVVVAMAVGAMWAGVAGLLKTRRGVSEVISTIMLNVIASGLIDFLVSPRHFGVQLKGSEQIATRTLPSSAHFPGIPFAGDHINGFIVIAALAGLAYGFGLNRTRFGFDLRATGRSETAAVASGVNVKRMVLSSMLISGAVAGLVGLPLLLGQTGSFSSNNFKAGIGFTGIAIALLGRNHPLGIAFGALLWSFLENSSQILDLEGVPKEIVTIMQGTIVLSVVVAYELVRRLGQAREQRAVAAELSVHDPNEPVGAPA
ncbi:MAG: ABC transporter permease, partial [Pseudonocardiales bacterium]